MADKNEKRNGFVKVVLPKPTASVFIYRILVQNFPTLASVLDRHRKN